MIKAFKWIRYGFVSVGILVVLYGWVVPKYHFWRPIIMRRDKKLDERELEHWGFALNQIVMYYHPHTRKQK